MSLTCIIPDPLPAPKKRKKNYAAQEIGRLRARVIALESTVKQLRNTVKLREQALHRVRRAAGEPVSFSPNFDERNGIR